MKKLAALMLFAAAFVAVADAADKARVLTRVDPLPVALDDSFEFRKTKLYLLSDRAGTEPAVSLSRPGKAKTVKPANRGEGTDQSIAFERQYRLFGAVTDYDRRQRYGNYFDFFWRARRSGDVTVRLEYRQEKLRAFVQAREIRYPNARGNHKTEFAVVGDDFLDDGRVTAWRCLLIENGRVVAENRSFLWAGVQTKAGAPKIENPDATN